jgi:long-subunit fatty acid transport protein
VRWLFVVATIVGCICQAIIGANEVHAGGIDYAGAGAQALGRAAAVAARADDPMVLMYNPAGLVELRGKQLMLNANVALMNACVDPIGYYGWGSYSGGVPSRFVDPKSGVPLNLQLGKPGQIGPNEEAYYRGAYDTVCMDQNVVPVPQLAFTARISDDFGIGLGLIFPSVTPQGKWGGENAIINGAAGLRTAATRYMMVNAGTVGIFPTLGLAYRLTNWLRIGVSAKWGMINVDNSTMAVVQPGTTPANDTLARVRAVDWFVPEITGSIHVVPVDAIDVVAGFHYQDDLDAPGTIDLTTGLFNPNNVPFTTTNQVTGVKQKFPWQAWLALRYADRLAPRPTDSGNADMTAAGGHSVRDSFEDERFDVELDLQYEMNARHRDITIDYEAGQSVRFQSTRGTMTMQMFPDPSVPNNVIEKRWKDQLSIRLGGTYNILPGLLGISVGAHYENRGVDPSYMQVDYWPVSRVGLHAGVRVRVAHSIDFFASYAHIFQETIVVSAPPHDEVSNIWTQYAKDRTLTAIDKRVGTLVSTDMPLTPLEEPKPAASDGQAKLAQSVAKLLPGSPPYVVNSGTYRSGIDVLALGVNVHF